MVETNPALARALADYLTAINSNDPEAVLAMLTDDAIFLPPNGPAVAGRDAIRPWIEGFYKAYRTHWEIETLELVVAADWAIEYAAERFTNTPLGGGKALDDVCKGITVYRRQADGTWKVARDIWNSDRPATST